MDRSLAAAWSDRLQPLVGYAARISVGRTAPHVWTGLDAVEVEVESRWTVGEIAAEGDALVVRGEDAGGRTYEVRVPVEEAYLGLDASGEFFLAGWPEGGERFRYLRISRQDDGGGRRDGPLMTPRRWSDGEERK